MRYLILLILIDFGCTGNNHSQFEAICNLHHNKFDYAIMGGMIIDGTGDSSYKADLLIHSDSIVFIGQVDTSGLDVRVIDATDQVVTPGFIDTHAHGDPFTDTFENFVSMGVTTILLGQDGRSPVTKFDDPETFFDSLGQKRILLNMAFLAGHGDIREQLGFAEKSDLTSTEILQITQYLDRALQSGCLGLSTGLEYLPGSLAKEPELEAIAKKLGQNRKFLMSHLRSEDDQEMQSALAELQRQGRYCQVHVSHLKVVYGRDKIQALEILENLRSARMQGINISADVYPYTASYTGIGIVFPEWAKSRRDFELAMQTRRNELRKFLHDKIIERNGPESTLFATRPFAGRTLAQVAQESGKEFEDILLSIGPVGASGAYFVMNEDLQETFILDSTTMICSDGGPGLRHPRSYGTFAKVIEKYVVQEKKMTLEKAIHKMSGLSASTFNLNKRGFLKPGYKADILIFSPKNIKAVATYENPFEKSEGFRFVFINGRLVIADKILSDRSGGVLLRHSKSK